MLKTDTKNKKKEDEYDFVFEDAIELVSHKVNREGLLSRDPFSTGGLILATTSSYMTTTLRCGLRVPPLFKVHE